MVSKAPSRKRILLLLAALAVLLIAALTQRSWLFRIPYHQAYRALQEENVSGAEWWLAASRRLSLGDAEGEFVQARICRHKEMFGKARESLARARALGFSPEQITREEWLVDAHEGRMQDALRRVGELLSDPQGEEVEICEAYVAGLTRVGNYPVALELLSTWERDYPLDPRPPFRRARILQDQRRWDEAEAEVQLALRRNPRHGPAALLMGELLLQKKRPQTALPYFEIARAYPVQSVAATLGKARTLVTLGEDDEARDLLEALLKENPILHEAAVELSRLELSQGQSQSALDRLQPFIASKPRDLDLRYAYAMALRGVGRIEQANLEFESFASSRAQLDRAVKLKESLAGKLDNVDILTEIAKACWDVGQDNEAILWLHLVIQKTPQHILAHELLSKYYRELREQNQHFGDLADHHAELANAAKRLQN